MKLPLTLTVADAEETLPLLRDAWPVCSTIDASEVTAVDTAGLQLLLAARISAQRAGRELHFMTPSAVLDEAARTLGLGRALGWAD